MSELLFGDSYCDSEPVATTCIKRMYLQAVLGRFQDALCMMEANVSPANAWEMPPPERKECKEKSCGIPAAFAYDVRSLSSEPPRVG